MTDYLKSRDDKALDMLIRRLEAAESLTPEQRAMLEAAKRILAERSKAKVSAHFDVPRAVAFLTKVAAEGRLCSYKELAQSCVSSPDATWSTIYRKIGGRYGLMQSIIRHCAANGIPQLSSLVVRQNEVALGPEVPPDRAGELEYGFKRGMVDEGLTKAGADTDAMVLEHRRACFAWAKGMKRTEL